MTKAELRNIIWAKIHYTTDIITCSICAHANKDKWSNDSGECNLLAGQLPFFILRNGVCKYHSFFGGGNIKRK